MKAKDVNPSNFKVENVVFENDDFSIHFGNHENDYDNAKYTAIQDAIKDQIK